MCIFNVLPYQTTYSLFKECKTGYLKLLQCSVWNGHCRVLNDHGSTLSICKHNVILFNLKEVTLGKKCLIVLIWKIIWEHCIFKPFRFRFHHCFQKQTDKNYQEKKLKSFSKSQWKGQYTNIYEFVKMTILQRINMVIMIYIWHIGVNIKITLSCTIT